MQTQDRGDSDISQNGFSGPAGGSGPPCSGAPLARLAGCWVLWLQGLGGVARLLVSDHCARATDDMQVNASACCRCCSPTVFLWKQYGSKAHPSPSALTPWAWKQRAGDQEPAIDLRQKDRPGLSGGRAVVDPPRSSRSCAAFLRGEDAHLVFTSSPSHQVLTPRCYSIFVMT